MQKVESESIKKARNDVAAIQSIIPGLGHMYKGHYLQGVIWMILSPVAFYVGAVLFLATGGLSTLFPLVYWFLAIFNAYKAEDHRKHHIGIL
jgi:hypothetical protein